MSSNTRDLNFQLSDIEDVPIRDHFVEVQEVHDESKIGSLYQNGYGIFTDTAELAPYERILRKAPGEIVLRGGTKSYDSGTGRLYSPINYSAVSSLDEYAVNVSSGQWTFEFFIIYKRP